MSLVLQGRGIFTGVLEGLRILGLRTMGGSGSKGWVYSPFCFPSSSFTYAYPPSELRSLFHSGSRSFLCSQRLAFQGCHRTGIPGTRLLQSPFCNTESHGRLASGYRALSPQSFCSAVSFLYGDCAVGAPIAPPCRLDDFCRPTGRLPPGSGPSGISEVSPLLYRREDIPISGSVLWAFIRASSLHTCRGFGLLYHALFWVPDPQIFRRLISPWILPSGDQAGERLSSWPLFRARHSGEPFQELSHSFSVIGLPGYDSPIFTFEGFPDSSSCVEGALSCRRVLLHSRAASRSLALPYWRDVVSVVPHPLPSAPDEVSPAPSSGGGPSVLRDRSDLVGRLLPPGSSVVVRTVPSRGGG